MSNLSSQLLKIARNVVMELRTMSASLFSIHEEMKTISKQQQAEQSAHNKPSSPVISILTTPTAIEVNAKTYDHKGPWERVFEVLELLGIAAVVAYAYLTYQMLIQATMSTDAAQQVATFAYHQTILTSHALDAVRDQATAAQQQVVAINRQVRQTERPWIYVTGLNSGEWTINGPFAVTLSLTNIGKSPARYLWAVFMIDKVKNGQSLLPLFIKPPKPGMTVGQWLEQVLHRPIWRTYAGIYFPNQPAIPLSVEWSEPTGKGDEIRPRLLLKPDYDDLNIGKQFFIVHGIVAYGDTFASKRFAHWTQYCNWAYPKDRTFTYAAGECTEYNDADTNQ